jgi:ubiquinone/menaquinone biosynthesis C-methylase UbiE
MQTNETPVFTGERFVPEISGNIELEHMHRYIYALAYAKGKTVLDIASGEGYGAALLASRAAFVIGVDIAEDAVAHAKQKYQLPNLEFRLGSCSKIPSSDGTIDLVVSFETIEHHDEHERMLAEIKRILKPDGMIVISSPDKAIYTDKHDYHNPFHIKELYREEFEALFRNHFKIVVGLGQKVMFGSGIIPNGEAFKTAFTSVDMGGTTSGSGLVDPVYNLVLASDSALPAAPASFLDVGIDASEILKPWRAAVAQRYSDVQRLEGELQICRNELQAYRNELRAIWKAVAISTEHTQRLNEHVQRLNKRSIWHFMAGRKDSSDAATILLSPFFDASWYLDQYPDVACSDIEPARHYADFGGKEGRQPGPLFDCPWYLEQNPDVSAAGINPLVHYMKYGWAEGRAIRVSASGRILKVPVS